MKLKNYKTNIDELTQKYETVVHTQRIPDQTEAITSSSLKKEVYNDYERAKNIRTQLEQQKRFGIIFEEVKFQCFKSFNFHNLELFHKNLSFDDLEFRFLSFGII